MKQTKKNRTRNRHRTFKKKDFNSGDGMLTSVWGPSLWHYLHVMSFNYPVKPTKQQKKHYKNFILLLKHVMPCKYCRINLRKNLIDQVTGTVRWRESMELAKNLGVRKITELGSGKVLTGIAKRMIENVSAKSYENPEDFEVLV